MRLLNLNKILLMSGLVVVAFLILNFGYLVAQTEFIIQPPQYTAPLKNHDGQQTAPPQEKILRNQLEIPSLGISAPVVYVDKVGEKYFQEALINGVVHYPGTAEPGQLGNCYIFGHSSDYFWSKGKYKTVFAVLPKIKIGAEIIVSDKAGNKFVYTVTKIVVASPKDLQYLDQGGNQKKILTVQTSYPVGTALKRFLAIAEL